jgi:hypothetical protein
MGVIAPRFGGPVSLHRVSPSILVGWLLLVSSSLVVRLSLVGAAFSVAESVAWVALGVGPALMLMKTFRGAPPPTIAEVLYAAEHPADRVAVGATTSKAPDA